MARARPRRALRHHTRALHLPADEPLRLAVVADTHSHPHPRAAEHLAAGRPHAILHAGDIGDLGVLDDLARIAPVHVVRGNIDGHAEALPDSILLEVHRGAAVCMRILLQHIAARGPYLRADVRRRAAALDAPVVVCGHSHVPLITDDEGVTLFNPGSIGPRRFTLPITFGRMELSPRGLRLRHVSCETGARWLPPASPR